MREKLTAHLVNFCVTLRSGFYFVWMSICLQVCICTMCMCAAHKGKQRMSGPLNWSQDVVNHHVGAENIPGSSIRVRDTVKPPSGSFRPHLNSFLRFSYMGTLYLPHSPFPPRHQLFSCPPSYSLQNAWPVFLELLFVTYTHNLLNPISVSHMGICLGITTQDGIIC